MNEIARNVTANRWAAGLPRSMADLLEQLGDISAERVRLHPPPGTATLADLEAVNEAKQGVCELVDGTLVEKGMGQLESWLAFIIAGQLDRYLETNDIGMVWGEEISSPNNLGSCVVI